jgi:hypothetical protein
LSKEEKSLKKVEERLREVERDQVWQRSQKIAVEKMLEEEKRRTDWRNKALSRLEEANITVKKLTKLDVPGRIRIDTIDKFLEKGNVNYKPIFDALSKFTNVVEEALSKFQESLQPLRKTMEELSSKLRARRAEHEFKDSRKKRKLISTDTDDDEISDPGSNPDKSPRKPGKKRSPVKVKTEVDKAMQEAQGPDMIMTHEDKAETSSKPPPTKQSLTVPENATTTSGELAGIQPGEVKL